MKIHLLRAFTLLIILFNHHLSEAQNAGKKISVLFLGNSYTYVNNLPQLIKSLALVNGDTLVSDDNNIGGYTFGNHFSNVTSKAKINAAPWKYVVLQAQSQEPAFPPAQVASATTPYALKLDSLIKVNNACSNTVFYETWGRKNGDASNCAFYPPLCTYTGMQNRLKISYKKFADTTGGIMAPVGEAFRKSISLDPTLELYDPDQSHPSLAGSYLAASVFYEVLFQKSVLSNTFNPGISPANALFLRQVAHNTVQDSLAVWNLGVNLAWADFMPELTNGATYQFKTASPTHLNTWYFGDGSTSSIANSTHNYSPGTFTASHVVMDGCNKDSVAHVITVLATDLKDNASFSESISVYPNPCSDQLHIRGEHFKNANTKMELRSITGQLLYSGDFIDNIKTTQLTNGIYFINLNDGQQSAHLYFLKGQ